MHTREPYSLFPFYLSSPLSFCFSFFLLIFWFLGYLGDQARDVFLTSSTPLPPFEWEKERASLPFFLHLCPFPPSLFEWGPPFLSFFLKSIPLDGRLQWDGFQGCLTRCYGMVKGCGRGDQWARVSLEMARGEQAGGVGAIGEDGSRDVQVGFGVHAWDVCGVVREKKKKCQHWAWSAGLVRPYFVACHWALITSLKINQMGLNLGLDLA